MHSISTGELGRQITQKAEDSLKQLRAARGRAILRLIIRYYLTNRTAEAVYNLYDLQMVKIVKGNLEGFQSTWIMVLSGMREQPGDDILELIYYQAVSKFSGLSEDIAHYDRRDEGSGTHEVPPREGRRRPSRSGRDRRPRSRRAGEKGPALQILQGRRLQQGLKVSL